MKNEYLVDKKENLKGINYSKYGIKKRIRKIPNNDKRIFEFYTDSNDLKSATILSKINNEIAKNGEVIVLINESSEYFIRKMFDKVIEFELKLRKLLRLASALNSQVDDKKSKENIDKLESITLGELFEFLFTDFDFNSYIRGIFNRKDNKNFISHQITKEKFISYIEEYKEITPWSILIGNRVTSLVKSYVQVLNARNSVAHAHSINSEYYHETLQLFKKISEELDSAIYFYETSEEKINEESDFNETFKVLYNNFTDTRDSFIKSNYTRFILNHLMSAEDRILTETNLKSNSRKSYYIFPDNHELYTDEEEDSDTWFFEMDIG